MRRILGEFGGKGGGSRDFAQGSLLELHRIDALLSALQTVARSSD
jgi:alanyl-tRNA synthetase